MAEINLIPQEIKVEQARTQVVKKTTIFALLLTLIVGIVAGVMIYQASTARSKITQLNSNIQNLRADINGLSEIEVSARNLDVKSQTVDSVLTARLHYSALMEELKKQVPANVVIETFGTAKDNTATVSGSGTDYLAIAQFVNNLAGVPNLFTDVALNSVNLDSQTSQAKFFIILTLNPEALKK